MQVKHTIKIYSLTGIILLCAFLVPSIVVARVYTPAPQSKSGQDNSGSPSSKTDGGINNHPQFLPSQTDQDPSINSNNLSQLSQVNQNGFVSDAKHTLNGIIGFFKNIYNDVKDVASSVVKSIWNWIVPPIKEVKYNDHISIKGTKDFINITKDNLKKIEAVEPGQQLLNNINNTKYHVTITTAEHVSNDGTTVAEGFSWLDAVKPKSHLYDKWHNVITDDNNNPLEGTGKGVSALVEYNPHETLQDDIELNCVKGRDVTNDAVLFHELTHASHMMHGVAEMTPIGDNWTTEEERITELTGHPNEADYLKANGFNYHRIDHACTMANN